MLLQALNKQLENYSQLGLYRQRQQLESAQGVEINFNGKTCISFCSNDYLGLANHPQVVAAFKAGADKYGVGSGASQLITGHSSAHRGLEDAFAEFLGRERALLFSNGYMANVGVLSAIMQEGSIFADKLNHASLIDGAHLSGAKLQRYAHKNTAHLRSLLDHTPSQQKMIVTDSVFSMDGDIADLPDLAIIAKQNNAWLMVDDAHGIGVLGKNGRGSCEYFNLDAKQIPILICPLGKALGGFGAIVAGDNVFIEYLIQFARSYIYTTALPPAIACAALASLQIIIHENWRREKLQFLINYFKKSAQQRALTFLPSASAIQSFVIGDNHQAMKISEQLLARGFVVTAIRAPTVPKNTARLRITLSSSHEEKQIDNFLDNLAEIYLNAI